MRLLVILWLVIISDGIGAILGARAAWQSRTKDNKRSELALSFALGLSLYALAAFGSTYNSIINAQGLVYSPHFLNLAIMFRLLQTIGVWTIALSLMNGHRGIIRRGLSRVLVKFE